MHDIQKDSDEAVPSKRPLEDYCMREGELERLQSRLQVHPLCDRTSGKDGLLACYLSEGSYREGPRPHLRQIVYLQGCREETEVLT